jgi:hypothetical protein
VVIEPQSSVNHRDYGSNRWIGHRRLLCICALVISWILAYSAAKAQPAGNGRDFRPPNSETVPAKVEVIPTRQKAFSIPFTVSQLDPRPTEVQLYVSADRGLTWTMYARQRPDANEFGFRATRDGEYWFSLWSVFNAATVPPEQMKPELKVLIDTVPPQLSLETITGSAGQLAATWNAADKHLIIETLRVHYQPVVIGQQTPVEWQEVAVDVSRHGIPKTSENGKLTWWPRTQTRMVNVRAEVRDTAGNVQIVTRRVTLPHTSAQPIVQPNEKPLSPPIGQTGSANPAPSHWPADNTTTEIPGKSDRVNQFTSSKPPISQPQRTHENGGSWPSTEPRRSTPGRFVSTRPDVEDRARTAPMGVEDWPRGERPRMTRSRNFKLRYDVDSVGPEGIESVTLWVTRDGGRTWRTWGTDSDNTSPFEVNVEEDGVYGFRVVVKGVNGLEGKSPNTGDPADLWVGVDTTKPTGKIVSAPFGTGKETGHLIINWQAGDERLATRPITIQFSQSRDGPWTPIAAGLPNNGRYAWLVDPRAPKSIYLRLEVRDEAGNVQSDQPPLPINLSAMIPRGRVRGFDVPQP